MEQGFRSDLFLAKDRRIIEIPQLGGLHHTAMNALQCNAMATDAIMAKHSDMQYYGGATQNLSCTASLSMRGLRMAIGTPPEPPFT